MTVLVWLVSGFVSLVFAYTLIGNVRGTFNRGKTARVSRVAGIAVAITGLAIVFCWIRFQIAPPTYVGVILTLLQIAFYVVRPESNFTTDRAGLIGINEYLARRRAYRVRRAAELGISVRELLRRKDLVASDPQLRSSPLDVFRASWKKVEPRTLSSS
jgi:hypothetical protein